MKLSLETALVTDLRKQVKKKVVAEQERAACDSMRDALTILWKQVDDLCSSTWP